MSPNVKQFIEENINLIETNSWDEIFHRLLKESHTTKDEKLLTDFIYTLDDVGIQPFENDILSLLNVKDFNEVLKHLSYITGWDNNYNQRLGELAYHMQEGISDNIKIENIVKLALKIGFDVYKTPNTWWGYDEKDQDYVIVHPSVTIKGWVDGENSYIDDPEDKIEFNPSEYKQIFSI